MRVKQEQYYRKLLLKLMLIIGSANNTYVCM